MLHFEFAGNCVTAASLTGLEALLLVCFGGILISLIAKKIVKRFKH